MILHLYGPDSYRRREKLHALIAEYRKKQALGGMLDIDLEENPEGWTLVREFISQPSMFSPACAAIVRESGAVDDKKWHDFLKSQVHTHHTFLFLSNASAPTKPLSFLLEDPVICQEFPRLEGRMLEVFLAKESGARALQFTPEAWRFLTRFIGEQPEPSWMGVQEIEKIALARFPQPISLADLQTLIEWRSHRDVRYVVRELAVAPTLRKKLALLEELFLQREPPAYIFNSLVYPAQGAQVLRLADYDVSVKSGKLEYEEALLDFVISGR